MYMYVFFYLCVDAQPCHSSPCLNGGTCRNDGESFSCTCFLGYEGNRCENEGEYHQH